MLTENLEQKRKKKNCKKESGLQRKWTETEMDKTEGYDEKKHTRVNSQRQSKDVYDHVNNMAWTKLKYISDVYKDMPSFKR